MSHFVLLSVAICCVVGVVIGARLLMLARRSGEMPELLVGTGILVYAGLALPLLVLQGLPGLPGPLFQVVQTVEQMAVIVTLGTMLAFTWRVFRPDAAWARTLTIALTAAAAIASSGIVAMRMGPVDAQDRELMMVCVSTLIACFTLTFLWTGVEALRYHAMMRRRLAIGLADPVVCNRFLLWAIWGLSCCALDVIQFGYSIAGLDFSRHPLALLTLCASTMISSAVWYLAFLAPAGYRRLILSRAH